MKRKRKIHCYTKKGEFVKLYNSVIEAQRAMGVAEGSITKAAKSGGTCAGYRWIYADEDTLFTPDHDDLPPLKTSLKHGISIQEFREKHDVMVIIRKAVRKLKKGELIPSIEFVQDLKLPGGVSYKDKIMSAEFEPYRGQVSASDIYWGHPEDITELKQDRLLK